MSFAKHLKVALAVASFIFQASWIKCDKEADNCTILIDLGTVSASESFLPVKDDCETVFYEITASKESSMIYIASSYLKGTSSSPDPTDLTDVTSSNTPTYLNETDVSLAQNQEARKTTVKFEELSILSNGDNSSVVTDVWYFTDKDFTVRRQYLSRTPHLRIQVNVIGNWSGNGTKLFYYEVKFDISKKETNKELGEVLLTNFDGNFQGLYHHPNRAYIFQILKTRNVNSSSISLNLKLDLKEGLGEYLLIGSGAIPFHGPPPLFIANVHHEKKFQVNDENAYIVYVATSTLREKTSPVFSLRWKHRGSKISTIDDEVDPVKDDVLQSIQVCIYNTSAGLEELQKSKTEQFKLFKEELARKSNEFLSSLTHPLSNISSSQISFYRLSAIEKSEKINKGGVLYVMLKIEGSSKGKAAFDREILQAVFRSISSFQNSDGYEIGGCPKRAPTSFGFYAMLPIFCTMIFFIWIWREKSFSHYFIKMDEGSIEDIEQDRAPGQAEENVYSKGPLPFQDNFDQGRRLTMDFPNIVATYRENASDFYARHPNSIELDNFDPQLPGVRNRHPRSETNEAFEDDEGNTGTSPKRYYDGEARSETENIYDTVRSLESVEKLYDTRL